MPEQIFDVEFPHFSKFPADQWRWPNFDPAEIACRDGTLMVNEHSMDCLQRLREAVGAPMIITSAYRSVSHNKRVKGASKSQHLRARAFDVRMDNHDPHEFEEHARAIGFTAFGYYPNSGFMHIDTRETPATWGTRFKPRRGNRFASPDRSPELPPVPKPAKAAPIATAGGFGGAAVLASIAGQVDEIAPAVEKLQAFGPVALVVVAVIILAVIYRDEISAFLRRDRSQG